MPRLTTIISDLFTLGRSPNWLQNYAACANAESCCTYTPHVITDIKVIGMTTSASARDKEIVRASLNICRDMGFLIAKKPRLYPLDLNEDRDFLSERYSRLPAQLLIGAMPYNPASATPDQEWHNHLRAEPKVFRLSPLHSDKEAWQSAITATNPKIAICFTSHDDAPMKDLIGGRVLHLRYGGSVKLPWYLDEMGNHRWAHERTELFLRHAIEPCLPLRATNPIERYATAQPHVPMAE